MKLLLLVVLPFIIASCGFSDIETKVLNEAASLLQQANQLKEDHTDWMMNEMDERIHDGGNKDRKIYLDMLQDLQKLQPYMDSTKISSSWSQVENFSKDAQLSTSINNHLARLPEMQYYPRMDSAARNHIISSCKYEIVVSHARMISHSCCFCFPTIKPFIETSSQTVEQGKAYKAKFFLGIETSNLKIICSNPSFTVDRTHRSRAVIALEPEISFSDVLPKKYNWNGRLHFFRDSVDLSLDYKVVSKCGD